LQFGEVTVVVEALVDGSSSNHKLQIPNTKGSDGPLSGEQNFSIKAMACSSFDEALEHLAFDSNRCPRAGEQLLALVRAGHHLGHLEREEDLLQSILRDAVSVLDAQRGAIVLAEGGAELTLKTWVTGRGKPRSVVAGRSDSGRFSFSQSLAQRSFTK